MGILKRKSPLFRRKSIRNAAAIEAEVNVVIQRSPFLLEAELRAQNDYEDSAVTAAATATPIFSRKEIETGALLGAGSFSTVLTIAGFKLSSSRRTQKQLDKEARFGTSSTSSEGSCTSYVTRELRQNQRLNLTRSAFDPLGEARYAIKFVRKELTKNSYSFRHAAADLVVEAKYLSALDHPNILKVRGMGPVAGFLEGHEGFFVIMDRLQETLGERIERWKQQQEATTSSSSLSSSSFVIHQIDYASQTAAALAYLHDRRILFRDLKPSNVGFRADDPHTVQLFDFGLCRELPANDTSYQEDDDCNEAFEMSGAGTYLYMAPEITTCKRYNLKADVYSWAFLVHEMMTLQRPFAEYSFEEHKEFVCQIGQRPSLNDIPQESVRVLLRQAWEHDPTERLTMRQVCVRMQAIVEEEEMLLRKDDYPSTIPAPIPPPPSHPEGFPGTASTSFRMSSSRSAVEDSSLPVDVVLPLAEPLVEPI